MPLRMNGLIKQGLCALAFLSGAHRAIGDAEGGKRAALVEVQSFGNNPGNLRMFVRAPHGAESLGGKRPMVMVLHGCGQDAESILKLSGWGAIADSAGAYLVLAQQKRSNNPMRCFNWYRQADALPGRGEVFSIAQMIEHAVARFPIDRARVSAYGVSAGAAMAVALAACHPDLLQQAAIVAGAPYGGVAKGDADRRPVVHPDALTPVQWAERVRQVALDPVDRYPRIVVVHGVRDPVADFGLARALVAQWTSVAGADSVPEAKERVDARAAVVRMSFRDSSGTEPVVLYRIEELGHRLAQDDEGRGGWNGKDIGFNSTRAIAREFGLMPQD
ncbi:MAG: PHB depolymerase family esterase [Flavobacteriales bacterium]|jgi:poly(hydroxyalkanoate) depolymerase family esterase|nr:PHB depolymerase family esterase [Flavobacteriales bacterium]